MPADTVYPPSKLKPGDVELQHNMGTEAESNIIDFHLVNKVNEQTSSGVDVRERDVTNLSPKSRIELFEKLS